MRHLSISMLAIAACSDPAPVIVDAPRADAAVDTSGQAQCLIQGDYGALAAIVGTAGNNGGTTVTLVLDPGPPGKDDLFFKLVAGNGVFAGGVAPGTYALTGADTNFLTCGLCTSLIADIIPGVGPSKFYFADAGSVTFTAVTPPVAGNAQNLHFSEIEISTGTKVPGGCEATIASVSFSTP
jgi:hypothetical protein